MSRVCRLTKMQVKWIAAVSMVVDHVGAVFFPEVLLFRVIGRLSFPLFAYFIYEGARYTRNIAHYFGRVFGLGVVCMFGYYIASGVLYGNVLITFSMSLLILMSLQRVKREGGSTLAGYVLLGLSVLTAYIVCRVMVVDYTFFGVLLPVFAQVSPIPLAGFAVGLMFLSIRLGGVQYFSLLALPLLLVMEKKQETMRFQRFFYLFYPAHLLILEGIALLTQHM